MGASAIDSVKAIREAEGIRLGQAKALVDESATWADIRPTSEWLRDLAEESLRLEEDPDAVEDS